MRTLPFWLFIVAAVIGASAFAYFAFPPTADFQPPETFPVPDAAEPVAAEPVAAEAGVETATFGSGCFWCTEAIFDRMKGVKSAQSGYSGGAVKNPTYEQVCGGRTGHAEVVQVTFDPAVVSYVSLLEVFWRSHDPTTLDRQGVDVGPQYRSVIFTHTDRQRELAETYLAKIEAARVFKSPVVTEIAPFTAFYPAEALHQDYYAVNGRNRYCQAVIRPKLDKLKAVFADKMTADGP